MANETNEKKEKTDEIIVDLFRLFHCMFLTVFFSYLFLFQRKTLHPIPSYHNKIPRVIYILQNIEKKNKVAKAFYLPNKEKTEHRNKNVIKKAKQYHMASHFLA